MIKISQKGDFSVLEKFLNKHITIKIKNILEKYGREGVNALSSATPIESGNTAYSWNYEIIDSDTGIKIVWTNSNTVDNVPVAILIQYGHGTKNGGYVIGRDYINPALRPIFDQISAEIWKEVNR